MFGFDFLSPHRLATSSGSVSLNSPLVPSHVIQPAFAESLSSSNKNCHSWIWPEPGKPVKSKECFSRLTKAVSGRNFSSNSLINQKAIFFNKSKEKEKWKTFSCIEEWDKNLFCSNKILQWKKNSFNLSIAWLELITLFASQKKMKN